jgi:hypothetical protein
MEMFLYTMHVSHPVFGGNNLLCGRLCQFYQFITVQVLQQTAREGFSLMSVKLDSSIRVDDSRKL